ncbi:MAG: histidine kinase N-terminal 7TM domain-containing protein [Acidimicrobiia bacterium]
MAIVTLFLAQLVLAWPRHLQVLATPWTITFVAFGAVGALIVILRPAHPIGWLFALLGMLTSAGVLAYVLATRWLEVGGPKAAGWADAIGSAMITAGIQAIPAALVLFPEGRPPSRRWRSLLWLAGASTLLGVLASILNGGWGGDATQAIAPSPLRVEAQPWGDILSRAFFIAMGTAMVASIVPLFLRFRRSTGTERQQVKWLLAAGAFVLLALAASGFNTDRTWEIALVAAAFSSIPAAVAIAILRYRLYDIDLVINRTLVYGSLTVLLGAVYVAGVVGLPRLLPLAEDNDLVVAGSTLAVAAVFSPLRRRTQAFVDRRFYRSRYDARRTLEAFSTRLREEVDLDDLRRDLVGVVQETLQPASVSVWLREPEGVGR